MKKRNFYAILCTSVILAVSGCQKAPDTVKEKAEKHQESEDVEETDDLEYVSLDHILDNREEVDYVNDWCNKNWTVFEPDYTYQVKTVYVCTKEKKKDYYYYFDVCKFYKGMPYDDIDFGISIKTDYRYFCNTLEVVMEHKNEISYFSTSENSFDIAKDETDETNEVDEEEEDEELEAWPRKFINVDMVTGEILYRDNVAQSASW